MDKFSTIKNREQNESKRVKIGSDLKPELTEGIINKWQSLIDTVAKIAEVPAGLIMQLKEDTIEVFLKSNTEGNPYKVGEEAKLVYGLYCETAIAKQEKLKVADATKSEVWKNNNPDVDINMISYLGFPINWPDGEVFGTVCLLDNKENQFKADYEDLLYHIKQHIENDLKLQILNGDLEQKNKRLEHLNRTKSKFLSLISHDIRGSVATVDELLKLIIGNLNNYDLEELSAILQSLSNDASASREALEDLLNWSKNDVAELAPVIEPINLINVIDDVLEFLKSSITVKQIKISRTYNAQEKMINTDKNMLSVALRNIISNAIKYNEPEGEVNVKVDHNEDKHLITITDTGIGMKEETVTHLFEYHKEHSAGTRGESSAGIGLMLSKEFLNKINAEVSVSSEVGKGTSFVIKI